MTEAQNLKDWQRGRLTVCLDFDGVLHSYTTPWSGPASIPDPPVPGAIAFMVELLKAGFEVAVYSSRSGQSGGVEAMQAWLAVAVATYFRDSQPAGVLLPETSARHWVVNLISWPSSKPAAHLTIDDRAFCFNGTFPAIESVRSFVPWNKRPEGYLAPFVDVVFDGPPGHEAGRFVEVEDETGKSIVFGQWMEPLKAGDYWRLRIPR